MLTLTNRSHITVIWLIHIRSSFSVTDVQTQFYALVMFSLMLLTLALHELLQLFQYSDDGL